MLELLGKSLKIILSLRRNVSYDRLKSREITFHNTGKILLKQEFSSDGYKIHEL